MLHDIYAAQEVEFVAWCAANPWAAVVEIKRLRAALQATIAERKGSDGQRIAAAALRVRSPASVAMQERAATLTPNVRHANFRRSKGNQTTV